MMIATIHLAAVEFKYAVVTGFKNFSRGGSDTATDKGFPQMLWSRMALRIDCRLVDIWNSGNTSL